MSDQKQQNIIKMTEFKSTMSGQHKGSLESLKKCRDLMTDRLSFALSDMLDKADDLFFDLVQKSGPSEHSFYFNAMREVRLKRTAIESGFKENFSSCFEDVLQGRISADTGNDEDPEVDIEESLALNASMEKIRQRCHSSLLELDQSMRELLKDTNAGSDYSPVSPETVCRAFQNACEPIESGIEVKIILFKLFEKYVTGDLDSIYTEMTSLLTENRMNARARQNSSMANSSDDSETRMGEPERQNNGIIRDKNYFIVANRIIKNEMNQHIGPDILPAFVRNFIYCHWSKLLLKIYIKEGVDSKAWLHAMEVIDDLVNCIGDRSSMNEKLMLSNVMPNLIQRLKFGMNVIPVKTAQREEFITELTQHHKNILEKARMEIDGKDKPEQNSEDITVPSFRTTVAKTPFMDELLVDNKPGRKNDFDLE